MNSYGHVGMFLYFERTSTGHSGCHDIKISVECNQPSRPKQLFEGRLGGNMGLSPFGPCGIVVLLVPSGETYELSTN